LIPVRGREPVGRAWIVDLLGAPNQPGRLLRGVFDRNDLVIFTVQDRCWHIELFQVIRLVRLREGLDAFVPKPQSPSGVVSSVSFVSTTNTARSLAGFVSLALALTRWRSPGSSEKLCPVV